MQSKYYRQIPKAKSTQQLFEVNLVDLHPTQMCIGYAEISARKKQFSNLDLKNRLKYLRSKPIPIIKNQNNELWILDRHHRLRALIELDKKSKAYGYLLEEIKTTEQTKVLQFLNERGWLYLHDSRGIGPHAYNLLPKTLLDMKDDPYRSLIWKLKKEGFISPEPLIPYHEFHWSRWLRTRSLPPFNSNHLYPALTIARKIVSSKAASHLPGWKGERR